VGEDGLPEEYLFPRISDVVLAQQTSVVLEVRGDPKPGNVTRGRPFPEISYEDFMFAAASIGGPLELSYQMARARHAEEGGFGGIWGSSLLGASRASVENRSNTIFGTLLLEIPLALGAISARKISDVIPAAKRVVAESNVDDALSFVESARACRVGGLEHGLLDGRARRFDVSSPRGSEEIRRSGATLLDLLRLSARYDLLSRELISGFPLVRRCSARYVELLREFGRPERASSALYCSLLSAETDTLIARRAGSETAEEVRRQAAVAMELGIFTPEWIRAMEDLDRTLRSRDLNPGALADLTAASVFAALLGIGL
jgi:triphosphoribosyl-dephospho-CoA synthase